VFRIRFRYLLPSLELALSVVFVLIPLSRCLPYYRLRDADGRELRGTEGSPFDVCIGTSSEFAMELNLPAASVVLPTLSLKWDYSNDQHDWFHDLAWRSVGFTIAGVVVWFFVGRVLDDLIEWRRAGALPGSHIPDLIFAVVTAGYMTLGVVTAAYMTLVSTQPGRSQGLGNAWLFVIWPVFWVLIGYLSLAMCIVQMVKSKKQEEAIGGA
jgi:hypothetical protein